MTAFLLVYLYALHFVADFLLQSREMATKKSSDINVLFNHCAIQYWTIILGLCPFLGFGRACVVSASNALIHGLIDWHIWKGYKWSVAKRDPTATPATWKYWEDHWFYTTIGFDQFLHISTLTLCLWLFP